MGHDVGMRWFPDVAGDEKPYGLFQSGLKVRALILGNLANRCQQFGSN